MGNKDKEFKKLKRRRIRIRLADSNDPESYICEVLDSSLENDSEEKDSEAVDFLPKSKEHVSKPKNYFEVLMSKDCRRSGKIKTNLELEENFGTVINLKEQNRSKERQIDREQRGNVNSKQETDSSDDENLLQIKNKCHVQNDRGSRESNEKQEPEVRESEGEIFTILESPKTESNKKTLSILNYFSKANPQNGAVKKNSHENKSCKINEKKKDVVTCKNAESSNRSEKKLCLNELNKENVKLAPLFHKKEKKIFDSAAQKARLDFLYNSLPIVKKVENKANDSDAHFPEVVHVQQKNLSPFWSVREIALPVRRISTGDVIPESDKKFRFDINDSNFIKEVVQCSTTKSNKNFIHKLKSKYLNLNLDSVIDNLKRKRDEYQNLTGDFESRKNSDKKIGGDEIGSEVLNTLWIEKYKPKSTDILGNQKPLKKLRDWLETWKSFDKALKALIKSKPRNKTESDGDEDDAFLGSDDEDYGLKAPGNVCILSGPHASGKTALVFALASELEFKVLELNASSKRTGKKVLSDLQEATQSHKVHHSNVLQCEMRPREAKKKKKRRKKSKKPEDGAKIILPNNSDCKISLILIEDADIVFEEHDEGFISAITSLVQTSKRPLIFITNEPNCPYLENFKKEPCLILQMKRPCFYESCAVLDVVSVLEGAPAEEEFLKRLVRRNGFDLRRSLLELQFWTQSRENSPCLRKEFDLGQLWWGLGKFLYKKDIGCQVTSKGCKRKRETDLFGPSDEDEETTVKKAKLYPTKGENFSVPNPEIPRGKANLVIGCYSKILDLVSVVDTFRVCSFSDRIFEFEYRPKDGLSLEENLEEVSWGTRQLTEELSGELVKLSTNIFARKIREKKKFDFSSPSWEEIRWQESQSKASEELSAMVPPQSVGDKRSLRLDYLPILRNICRIERSRSEAQFKRKNRFYHYLSNLGTKLDECNVETNCKIFSR